MPQNRVFWAVEAVGLKPDGDTGTYTVVHGLQSVGLTTTFNLEQVFELGQLEIYENIEDVPDVEVTLEKVIDGYPIIYHLATQNAPSAGISGRSNQRSILAMSIFGDTNDSASGTPLATVELSGLYISSLTYTFPVDGNCTEAATLVGNNKLWTTGSGSWYGGGGSAFDGTLFDNTDEPLALTADSGGVQRRENVVFNHDTTYTKLPTDIPGISSSGTNDKVNDVYGAHVQSVSISIDLGRDNINELGRKGPYHRFVTYPVEVSTDVEIMALSGDMVSATEAGVLSGGNNVANQTIQVVLEEGLVVNAGTRNKLSDVSYGGGDAGGGNATITYSYTGYNILTITHPQDPSAP